MSCWFWDYCSCVIHPSSHLSHRLPLRLHSGFQYPRTERSRSPVRQPSRTSGFVGVDAGGLHFGKLSIREVEVRFINLRKPQGSFLGFEEILLYCSSKYFLKSLSEFIFKTDFFMCKGMYEIQRIRM